MQSNLEGHDAVWKADSMGLTRASKSRDRNEQWEHLEQSSSALAEAPNGVWASSIWKPSREWEWARPRDTEEKRLKKKKIRAEVECPTFGMFLKTIKSSYLDFYSERAFTRKHESVLPQSSLPESTVPHCTRAGWDSCAVGQVGYPCMATLLIVEEVIGEFCHLVIRAKRLRSVFLEV